MPSFGQPLTTLDGLRALTTPLQSSTTRLGWHSSRARTTAKGSALKTDCRQPGRAIQARSPVSVT
eukprot:3015563-Amphidinium_carterae.1